MRRKVWGAAVWRQSWRDRTRGSPCLGLGDETDFLHTGLLCRSHGHRNAFVPHVLIVQAGTSVLFPNNDVVSHHVYSFSDAKAFEFPLYKGNAHPPLLFEKPGLVVLGCNIHDGMLGYVVVVDTPHFAKTDEQGVARIDGVPSGDYVVAAWTPRARPAALPPTQQITVGEGTAAVEILINGRLSPAHEHTVSSLTWDRY